MSQFVIDEASRGDPDAAKRRLNALQNVGLLLPDPEIEAIADKIVSGYMMPPKAKLDALHVASAVLAGVEYLLTHEMMAEPTRNRNLLVADLHFGLTRRTLRSLLINGEKCLTIWPTTNESAGLTLRFVGCPR